MMNEELARSLEEKNHPNTDKELTLAEMQQLVKQLEAQLAQQQHYFQQFQRLANNNWQRWGRDKIETDRRLEAMQQQISQLHLENQQLLARQKRAIIFPQIPKDTKSLVNSSLIILLLLIAGAVALKLGIYHWQIIANPFPNEYREGAVLLSTDLLLKGGNPYSLSNQPEYTNVYGIIYNLVVAPFAKLFGMSLPVHRMVSGFFILASCGIFFSALRWQKATFFWAISGTLILYSHLLYFTTPLTRPDSLGFCLFLASLLIPWRWQYSNKSLLISSILGVLAFFTKPYFILSVVYLGSYLFLFKSKRKGITQGILALGLWAIALLLINQVFETYLNNTIWIHVNVAAGNFNHAIRQLGSYMQINLGLSLILLLLVVYSGIIFFKQPPKAKPKIDLFNLRKPLLNLNINLIDFCLVSSLILFLIKLGQHTGSWLIYAHHLISPFLIFTTCIFLTARSKDIRTYWLNPFLILLVIINLLQVSSEQFLPTPDYGLPAWNNLVALVSRYQNIFNSPAIASLLVSQGKKVYDSGQSEYFVNGSANLAANRSSKIQSRNQEFFQEVSQSLQGKKYDLVVLTKGHSPFIPANLLKKYYRYQSTAIAPMSAKVKRNWQLEIWTPKP